MTLPVEQSPEVRAGMIRRRLASRPPESRRRHPLLVCCFGEESLARNATHYLLSVLVYFIVNAVFCIFFLPDNAESAPLHNRTFLALLLAGGLLLLWLIRLVSRTQTMLARALRSAT